VGACKRCCQHFERATDGAAAARRDAEKHRAYSILALIGYPLVPLSVETYGRLGKPAVVFLHMPGAKVMAGDDVSKCGFVAAAMRELSIFVQGQLPDASGTAWCAGQGCWPGLLPVMCVTSGVLCAVGCFPCFLECAPLSLFCIMMLNVSILLMLCSSL
jgi:hypothetical protein